MRKSREENEKRTQNCGKLTCVRFFFLYLLFFCFLPFFFLPVLFCLVLCFFSLSLVLPFIRSFLTPSGLLKEYLLSPTYQIPYDVIILDEIHERAQNMDICVALLAKVLTKNSSLKVKRTEIEKTKKRQKKKDRAKKALLAKVLTKNTSLKVPENERKKTKEAEKEKEKKRITEEHKIWTFVCHLLAKVLTKNTSLKVKGLK